MCIPACTGTDTPRQTPPWADTPLPQADTPHPEQTPPGQTPPGRHLPGQTPPRQTPPDGHCSGWHTSYWNTFLFCCIPIKVHSDRAKAKFFFDICHFYRSPMKLWEGNVFDCVCLSVHRRVCPCDHHPWCITPYHTGHWPCPPGHETWDPPEPPQTWGMGCPR